MAGFGANFLRGLGIIGGVREARKILQKEHDEGHHPFGGKTPPGPHVAPVSSPAAGAASHDVDLAHVHGWFGYLKELFVRFGADLCPSWAASLSFFSILSLVPVLLCGLAMLGFVIHDPKEAAARVQDIIANLLPGESAQKQAAQLIQEAHIEQSAADLMAKRGWAGLIGIGSLFWSALQIVLNATTPMNAAFRTKETRNWIVLRLRCLGILLGAGLLFLLSLLPAAGIQFLSGGNADGSKAHVPLVLSMLSLLIGVGINAVMFSVIYRFLPSPSAKSSWKEASVAGGIVAILWEIAKRGFAEYLSRFGEAGYNKLYGSLGGLVALIFWIYYSSMLLLLGAEIAKLYSDAQDAKKHRSLSGGNR